MKDSDCVSLLQWALPRLRMRWPGFRKVRCQVCKRIDRRCRALGLETAADYRVYLETHPEEWATLDALCRVTISRFYRNRAVFDQLAQGVWPALAEEALGQGETTFRCWSIGCASGEEPYTLSLLCRLALQPRFSALTCHILATEADENLLRRAQAGRYPASSLKDLPPDWRQRAFTPIDDEYVLRDTFRSEVTFTQQDIRVAYPAGVFRLILCRNLVLTYFAESLQRQVLGQISARLQAGGALVIGQHEALPQGVAGFRPWFPRLGIYRKGDAPP
jgi:chemotaxis protein methyltransferase CheR